MLSGAREDLPHDLGGRVGRAVVDHDDLALRAGRSEIAPERFRQRPADAISLVEGWNDE